jgi:hypothetical protein
MQDADLDITRRRIWDHLKANSVDDGRALSNPLSVFVKMDGDIIR